MAKTSRSRRMANHGRRFRDEFTIAIRQKEMFITIGVTRLPLKGRQSLLLFFISPNKDFGGGLFPRWMFYPRLSFATREEESSGIPKCCDDVGPFLAAELFDHDFFASHELNTGFLLLVGFPETIRWCRTEILLNQLHFKDGFFPSDLPKRKRTAGLRLKEDFSKKRISRL